MSSHDFDAIVVGGGHNGLTNAAYLGKAGLRTLVLQYARPDDPCEEHAFMELVLEALHQHSLLGKDQLDGHASYGDLMGSVLGGLSQSPDPDDEDLDDYRSRYGGIG